MRNREGLTIDNAYRLYRENGGTILRPISKKIILAYNKELTQLALSGKTVQLPHACGTPWIKLYQTNYEKPPVDLNETKKAGKTIYHLNLHSEGYMGRWIWSKRNNLMRNLIYYSFQACRANKRAVAAIMKKDGHKRYFS